MMEEGIGNRRASLSSFAASRSPHSLRDELLKPMVFLESKLRAKVCTYAALFTGAAPWLRPKRTKVVGRVIENERHSIGRRATYSQLRQDVYFTHKLGRGLRTCSFEVLRKCDEQQNNLAF